MTKFKCPIAGCEYETEDTADSSITVALLNLHASSHTSQGNAAAFARSTTRVEKLKRPTITVAGSSEEWEYRGRR